MRGKQPGPSSIIIAGVHGNEKCGIEALEQILPDLRIESGEVTFSYGNPRAIELNKRFTETNLNRMFKDDLFLSSPGKKSYEYDRAQVLKKYLNRSEVLLDIHASATPNSKPFVICEINAREITRYLPAAFVVSGFDKFQPGGTDYYMNKIGRIGICLECGYLGDPRSTKVAQAGCLTFLRARGHIQGEVKPRNQSRIRIYELYLTKTDKFTLSKTFDDFENLREGQLIGIDGAEEIRADRASIILFAGDRNQVGEEAFLLGERVTA